MATAAQAEFNELMRDKTHRSGHPSDDSDNERHPNNRDNDDDERQAPVDSTPLPRPSMSLSRDTIPRTRFAANTGPKGVIADAQNFRDSRRAHRQSQRGGQGTLRTGTGEGGVNGNASKTVMEEKAGSVDEEEGEEEEDEDDEFMSEWRQNRLQELQSGTRDRKIQDSSRRQQTWSGIPTVDGNGYLDAVEKSPPDTAVVVYIYDDQSAVSDAIESCLRELTRSHPAVRFIRLHFHLAEMDRAGVPAILAYRGGEMFASLVPIVDEIPDDADLEPQTLEAMLSRHQILR